MQECNKRLFLNLPLIQILANLNTEGEGNVGVLTARQTRLGTSELIEVGGKISVQDDVVILQNGITQ